VSPAWTGKVRRTPQRVGSNRNTTPVRIGAPATEPSARTLPPSGSVATTRFVRIGSRRQPPRIVTVPSGVRPTSDANG
jgi:hypothetical protein